MIRSRTELMKLLQSRIGEDTSDDAIALIEDVSDTLDDYETRAGNPEESRRQLEELDKSWRERYKARFFGKPQDGDEPKEPEDPNEPEAPQTFEQLFK